MCSKVRHGEQEEQCLSEWGKAKSPGSGLDLMLSQGQAKFSLEDLQLHGAAFYDAAKQSRLSICPNLKSFIVLKYISQMLRTVLLMGSFQTGTT